MTARNPLALPLTTAAVIAETRLKDADVTPEDRVRVGRAIAAVMTPAERAEVARRSNDAKLAEARSRMNGADAVVGAVLHSCPRCHVEARGSTDEARADFFESHYNRVHGGYH